MELSGESLAFSDLVGTRVRDRSGRVLGRVFEARAHFERDGSLVVDELMVGRHALWRRLRGSSPAAHGIPWASVVETRAEEIVVHA